jgi:HSP20 family molecular chaperone IbpA
VQAALKDGVLAISFPKVDVKLGKSRKISIE